MTLIYRGGSVAVGQVIQYMRTVSCKVAAVQQDLPSIFGWLERHPGLAAWAQCAAIVFGIGGTLGTIWAPVFIQARAERKEQHRLRRLALEAASEACSTVSAMLQIAGDPQAWSAVARVGISAHLVDPGVVALHQFPMHLLHDVEIIQRLRLLTVLVDATKNDALTLQATAQNERMPSSFQAIMKERLQNAETLRNEIAKRV